MTKPIRQTAAAASRIIEDMAQPVQLSSLGPIAGRFIYSLRLIALHERVKRDPVPELTVRLGGVEIAAKSLSLSQAITATWPENIHVSRFCCQLLTHDEATIGALIDCAEQRDRSGFEAQVHGLIRPEREHRLWDAVLALVMAEMHAH
ncbi:MAG: DNA-directed RNA polymerase subunit beta' [Pseudomonadota bacterium]